MRSKWKKVTLNSKVLSRQKKGAHAYRGQISSGPDPKDIIILANYRPFVTVGVANEIAAGNYFAFAYREVTLKRPEETLISVVISRNPSIDIFLDTVHKYRICIPSKNFKPEYFPEHNNGDFARIFIWDGFYLISDMEGDTIIAHNRGEFDCTLDSSRSSVKFDNTDGMDELEKRLKSDR